MLSRDDLRDYCLSLPGANEDFPFGADVAVYKVAGKMFALLPISASPVVISLKCDPVRAVMLRDTYPAVEPGYHLNKRHWNSVRIDGTVPDDDIRELIEHSYALVVAGLPRKQRDALRQG
jgi:predicted DNA-binding protein (MmcQ/YjbR family)